MNLKGLGEETVNHGLFGGIEHAEKHQRYNINLSNVDGSYNCELEVLDEKKICASLPRMNDDNCLKQLKDLVQVLSKAANSSLKEGRWRKHQLNKREDKKSRKYEEFPKSETNLQKLVRNKSKSEIIATEKEMKRIKMQEL
ncbi:uncharacterized protein NPIL_445891 [Nephila pilipes]|uniref:Uncharacterized protein n=1 Tax=Nephila pilipes TaxID=299642 RepID=A0A8X6QW26_NEPPI|nr:uncharacterized protein NPIL_445891 [Nephila pilipes]